MTQTVEPAATAVPARRRAAEPARPDAGRSGVPTPAVFAGAVALLVASVTLAVTFGSADLGPLDVWRSIAGHLGLGSSVPGSSGPGSSGPDSQGLSALNDAIVWQLRLPRVLSAAAVGAGLALAGAVMQSLTRNPLADPYLLGLSSGASLGAVSVLVLGLGVVLPLAAFLGATAALLATLTLAGALGALTPTRTVLAGLAVGQLCAAATSFVIFWSATGDSYREILSWLMGSLGGATWTSVVISVGAVLVVGVGLASTGGTLDAFAFGDTAAAALGIDVRRTRWVLLTAVALLTGALVSVSGSIGFIGLILPQATRLLVGARHRVLLPLSALLGATFLVWADTAARTLFDPRELPVGILTAFIGAPVFAWILWRRRGVAA
ncbi:putative F420-0 ABC transporter permease subunit [Cellulomonas fimi]|uniref:Iron chelate uptake ABC transporter family permease subunit n=1 Tax=Cellulomonas fimi TaxID=1708 RepID=A0A7Y0QFI6_CELFI|nr:putative F420-0 ABC transporter permease subunit [Cellulomonas fimi]NMR19081.1 iron chelate uptake ABC transporter family permease subunit [Cellulomonas fimi]